MPLFLPVQLFDRDLGQLLWADEKIKGKSRSPASKKDLFKAQWKLVDELSHEGRKFHLILGMTCIFFTIQRKKGRLLLRNGF